jgi:hypothetical protein
MMPMSGSGLASSLKTQILAQLNAQFPTDTNLLNAEKTAINSAKDKLAQAIADGDGPTTVDHIKNNAVVSVSSVTGVTPGGGVSGPGSGTVG